MNATDTRAMYFSECQRLDTYCVRSRGQGSVHHYPTPWLMLCERFINITILIML